MHPYTDNDHAQLSANQNQTGTLACWRGMKSLSKQVRNTLPGRLLLVCLTLSTASCNLFDDGGTDEPAPTPNMTGLWGATYTSQSGPVVTLALDADINAQSGGSFSGIWKYTSSGTWPADSLLDGYTYPGTDRQTLVEVSFTAGGDIVCCVPLFGCSTLPAQELTIFGYLVNDTVTDDAASYRSGCGSSVQGSAVFWRQ